jgi:hypothetical protein
MTRDQWCIEFVNYLVLRGDREVPLKLASPDISRIWVETRTALPLECPFIEVSNLDERAGNAEAKLYRRS